MARVCSAINFKNGADNIAAAGEVLQFADDFRDDATLTLVAHADADVGNEEAFKGSQGHGSRKQEQ